MNDVTFSLLSTIKNDDIFALGMMRRALLLVILLCTMPLSSVIAGIPAPNDNGIDDGDAYTLSVDGYVTTKFASVGSNVEIIAMTRGHTDETIVTADILRYPKDPMEMLTSAGMMADEGVLIDRVVLTSTGVHEEDADTMMWEGNYVVPVSSLGGVYGASIVAEDGLLRATDN
nr:hypothetical protein [Candidatus Poseidoniales archaeon]